MLLGHTKQDTISDIITKYTLNLILFSSKIRENND